jgi:hypothetical protein
MKDLAKRPQRRRAQHKRPNSQGPRGSGESRAQPAADEGRCVSVRMLEGEDAWELVPPRCAVERALDLEEVRQMVDAGELDVARDECRWLLEGCSDCLEAHRILGEIALEEQDIPLARGHFGYAYRLGTTALERAGTKGPLPYRLEANQAFFESAKGLVWCLLQLGKPDMAAEIVAATIACDPSDPLKIADLMNSRPAG